MVVTFKAKPMSMLMALVLSIGLLVGCEHDDDNDSGNRAADDTVLTAMADIFRINAGNEIELDNRFTLVVTSDTRIQRLRSSCSGFNNVTFGDISPTDTLEYEYFKSDADFPNREVMPTLIRAFRAECLAGTSEDATQFVEDSDFDGVGDVVDNCIDEPNSNQVDTDGDGAGDVCDADPNDPAVQ